VIVTVSGFVYGPMHLSSGLMGPMLRPNLEGADVNPKTNAMLYKVQSCFGLVHKKAAQILAKLPAQFVTCML